MKSHSIKGNSSVFFWQYACDLYADGKFFLNNVACLASVYTGTYCGTSHGFYLLVLNSV